MESESRSEIWNSIRSYGSEDIPAAMRVISESDFFEPLMRFLYPDKTLQQCIQRVLTVRSTEEFMKISLLPGAHIIAERYTSGISCAGIESLSKDCGYLFVSNHRDIAVDAGLFQMLLVDSGLHAAKIAFGENLIFNDFFMNLCKANNLFSVPRFTDMGKYVRYAPVLAEYIRSNISAGVSVWIAQRNGRTKDGSDKTEPALLKLFGLHGEESQIRTLKNLNIVPLSVSYEYEPCDLQKVRELFIKRRDGIYKKVSNEDFNSVMTGLMQPKGEVHYTICSRISDSDIDSACESGRLMFPALAELIDKRIYEGYHCFASNYVAYDLLHGGDMSKNVCDENYRAHFCSYVSSKVDVLSKELGECNREVLRRMFLEMYANPLSNKLLDNF